jgi:sulfite reductase alpha subunit
MHCINVMPKALRPGKERGATILIGAKAPIVEGALLSSVLIPFIEIEEPYDDLKELIEDDLGRLGRARQEPRARR